VRQAPTIGHLTLSGYARRGVAQAPERDIPGEWGGVEQAFVIRPSAFEAKPREVLDRDESTRVARGMGEAHALIGLVVMEPIYRAFPDLEPENPAADAQGRRVAEQRRRSDP
jgi:hypothetical protein